MSVSVRSRSGAVISFLAKRTQRVGPPWTNDELAQLFGVAQVLSRAGLAIDTESGLTDEGDPWFAFIRPDTDEVVAHFARIDGRIVGTGLSVAVPVTGVRLRDVVGQLLEQSRGRSFMLRDETRAVILHPIVGLATFIALGVLAMNEAQAGRLHALEDNGGHMQAVLDFVVEHIRSTAENGVEADARPHVADDDVMRPIANGKSDGQGTKYFHVLASVVAAALAFSGDDQSTASSTGDLPLIERLIAKGAMDQAAATGENAAPDGTETATLAGASQHASGGAAFEIAFDDVTQDAPSVPTVEKVEESGADRTVQHGLAERPAVEPIPVRHDTAAVIDLIDPGFAAHQADVAVSARVASEAAPAPASPGSESTLFKSTYLLADLLEAVKAPTLVEGHSYVLLDFAASIQALGVHDLDRLGAAHSGALTTVSFEGESRLVDNKPAESLAPAPVHQVQPILADSSVLEVASIGQQTVKLSSSVETVLFNGGNLTIQNFQLGVDKLLIASLLLDWSKATVSVTGTGDAVFHFDNDSSVTLVGVLNSLSA